MIKPLFSYENEATGQAAKIVEGPGMFRFQLELSDLAARRVVRTIQTNDWAKAHSQAAEFVGLRQGASAPEKGCFIGLTRTAPDLA